MQTFKKPAVRTCSVITILWQNCGRCRKSRAPNNMDSIKAYGILGSILGSPPSAGKVTLDMVDGQNHDPLCLDPTKSSVLVHPGKCGNLSIERST